MHWEPVLRQRNSLQVKKAALRRVSQKRTKQTAMTIQVRKDMEEAGVAVLKVAEEAIMVSQMRKDMEEAGVAALEGAGTEGGRIERGNDVMHATFDTEKLLFLGT